MRRSIPLIIVLGCCLAALVFIATVNSEASAWGSSSSSSSEEALPPKRSRKNGRNRKRPSLQSFSNSSMQAVYKTKYSDKCPKDSSDCQELCEEGVIEKGWEVKGKCTGSGKECQCKEYTVENLEMGEKFGGSLGKFVNDWMGGF